MILNKLTITALLFNTVSGIEHLRGRLNSDQSLEGIWQFQEGEEDSSFWERELGSSRRRNLNDVESNTEDVSFWERELGGSNRRNLNLAQENEDDLFWTRELKASIRVRNLIVENEDASFWERELGGSHRRRMAEEVNQDEEDVKFWEQQLGGIHR